MNFELRRNILLIVTGVSAYYIHNQTLGTKDPVVEIAITGFFTFMVFMITLILLVPSGEGSDCYGYYKEQYDSSSNWVNEEKERITARHNESIRKNEEERERIRQNQERVRDTYREVTVRQFEVSYELKGYPSLIWENAQGKNCFEVIAKYKADPKVKRFCTIRELH